MVFLLKTWGTLTEASSSPSQKTRPSLNPRKTYFPSAQKDEILFNMGISLPISQTKQNAAISTPCYVRTLCTGTF